MSSSERAIRTGIAITVAALALSACASKEMKVATAIPIYNQVEPGDNTKPCESLKQEIAVIDSHIATLRTATDENKSNQVMAGLFGAFSSYGYNTGTSSYADVALTNSLQDVHKTGLQHQNGSFQHKAAAASARRNALVTIFNGRCI